ncbi:uncharacterized protein LOC132698774 [Cylas formicarius]|uniref:uncharacterized protein LOC132698774 n=1 Tax=Cylas formicarius TaxID=197179 RepID=UPI0029589914|nr:uncharacterized protein LOC132698774 [Cylas formicarius]
MAKVNGKFEFVSQENVGDYYKAAGFPEEIAKAFEADVKPIAVSVIGDKITVAVGDQPPLEYTEGKEIGVNNADASITSVAKLDGDTLTISSKFGSMSEDRVLKFSDEELVITAANNAGATSTRVFKRV